ncbi:MAG: nucleotidyltransferase family protein [Candidatus Heimdallarchaeota archaeon]
MQKSTFPEALAQKIKIINQNMPNLIELGVKKVGIFGSFVTGSNDEESDLDILIEFNKDFNTYDNLLNVHFLLQKLFPQKIDLVTINGLSPYIKESVLTEVVFVEASS